MELIKASPAAQLLVIILGCLLIPTLCALVGFGIGVVVDAVGWMPNFEHHSGQVLGLCGATFGISVAALIISEFGSRE